MKKLLSLILVLCMACMLIPAMAEDITGDWYASFGGITMAMTINADGTLSITAPGEETAAEGTWTREGDQLTLTVDDSPATVTVKPEGLEMSEGGLSFLFTREPAEAVEIAEVKADAAAEEFYGDWTMKYLEGEGMVLDPGAMGMTFPDLKLGEGTVEFVAASEDDLFALIFGMLGLTNSYADGTLTLTATAEGAEASGKVEMLVDGMIKVTLDNGGSLMILYYAPAAAAEEPAA